MGPSVADGVGVAVGAGALGGCDAADADVAVTVAGELDRAGTVDGCGCVTAGADGVARPRAGATDRAVDPG